MERRRDDERLDRIEIEWAEKKAHIDSLWWHHRNDNVIPRLGEIDKRLSIFEELAETLTEKRNHAAFTDEQVKRIKELFDERAEVHAGRAFLRMVGAAIIGATSALLAYLGIRGH